jgi:DNA methylase
MTNEQREKLIEILQSGHEIDPDWERTIFPPTRREYELVYGGKEREEEIIADTMAVPLQAVRTFGKNGNGWHNMLIFGDNLQVMRTILDAKERGELRNADGSSGVRLVYIDPPFATKKEFQGSQEQRAYQDKIAGSQFIEFIRKRLVLLRKLMHDEGIIIVHLDIRKGHYLKVILDEVFGESNCRNEVIWKRTGARSGSHSFNHIHDSLFVYSASSEWTWNVQHTPYSDQYVDDFFTGEDSVGGKFRATILTAPGIRTGSSGKPWKGIDPTAKGRHWAIPGYIRPKLSPKSADNVQAALDELEAMNRILWPDKEGGTPSFKQYLDEMEGVELQSIWTDIRPVSAKATEQAYYPTQKPESLLERLIVAFTKKGDIVLDCFAESGTACAVSEKLARRWIAIDCGKFSIYTVQKRLLRLQRDIGNKGPQITPKPFTLYNAGLYDFSRLKELKWDDWRFFALNLFQCKDKKHTIGGIDLDGTFKNAPVLVFDHFSSAGAKVTYDTINDLHDSLGNKVGRKFFIIAPALCFSFQEDYVDKDKTRYYALRIPYSIINELHTRDFTAIKQPADETEVNDTVESVGFDFIRTPTAKVSYSLIKDGGLFKFLRIRISSFMSEVITKSNREYDDLESLAMMMVDFDYDGDVFNLDYFCYGAKLKQAKVFLDFQAEQIGDRLMLVLVDIFGNEYREVKTRRELGIKTKKQ